ncbi:tetratricopeptide repeat protein [Sphingobacterium sp. SRCM116780]|uniref:tetratricopeptide repeat protein n=1 Tax=Sphingobacterium sp. SRCM116780 TaxID=2907623 RepID=UPI001F2EAA8E|nr:tetratricopeptide repeat protein [Sphingobacterium sp. SRCM116780]UIR57235.1 tetratricopeptide repeat protein [Sphingobacterium sp. SRCM116780]
MIKTINVLLLTCLLTASHVLSAQEKEANVATTAEVVVPEVSSLSNSSDDSYQVAWDLYKAEKYEEALKVINKLIAKDKGNVAYYQVKCYILIGLKRNADIITTATKGLELDAEYHSFYDIRGNTYYFDLKPELARSDYQKMIQLKQDNARYFNNFLKLLNEMRKDDDMINVFELFENSVKSGEDIEEPHYIADVYFYGALAYQRKKDNLKAVELLSKAIENSPEAAMYYNNRGLIFQDLEKLLPAKKDLDKAIELDNDNPVYYENRYSILFDLKKYQEAQNDLLKVISLGNSDLDIYASLALTYDVLNNYSKAAEYYDLVLQKSPKQRVVLGNYAYALFELNQIPKSIEMFERALVLDPSEIDVLVGLATLYHLDGKESKSEEIVKDIKTKTSYQLNKNLLQTLEKEDYKFSSKFKSAWEKLF